METVLLVLILVAGADERALAGDLAAEIERRCADRLAVQVLHSEAAEARLQATWELTTADLAASKHLGQMATRDLPDVVLLRLETRAAAGDQVVDAALWAAGAYQRLTVISGGEGAGDPLTPLAVGVVEALPGWAEAGGVVARSVAIVDLVEVEDWIAVLTALAARSDPSPRERYYGVLAYVQLGRREAAEVALAKMRAAHGQHFLVAAAEGLIPASVESLAL
ncbi:MAG: hypothetical protein ACYTF0_07335, partial [Planctomycetota bacterium]